jgi:hypothetical protein
MSKSVTIPQSEYDALRAVYNAAKNINFDGVKTANPKLVQELNDRRARWDRLEKVLAEVAGTLSK